MTSPAHPTVSPQPVQVERMLPHQIEAALAARSVVYVPLGSIEYHSHHLPLGLDGLTAHGVCTRAAAASGGVVLPTLWFGTGGTHTTYPWTIMTPTAAPLTDLVAVTLRRLSDFGVQLCVLFTGHFADEQLALIDTAAADWNATGARPHVLPLAVNRSDAPLAPDHAGIFETSLLHALAPGLVQLHRLPGLTELPIDSPGQRGDWDHRHTPGHPLWGVMGPDPRTTDLHRSQRLLGQVVDWVCREVAGHLNGDPDVKARPGGDTPPATAT